MTPQDKTTPTQDNQNTPDNNTTDQTTTHNKAPHYITKSPQHNTKNLPLQVLGDETSEYLEISSHEVVRVKLAPVELPELSEEQLAFAREWVAGMLFSREGVKMMQEFMDESPPVSVEVISVGEIEIEGEVEESLTDEQYVKLVVNLNPVTVEQADSLQDWWKDEKGEI